MISQDTGTAAVPAECPSDHPTSCNYIGAPDYCCPSSNTCNWSNSQVVCCPSGQNCEAAGGYQPTSYWTSPTSVYYAPTPAATTVYQGGGGGIVAPGGVVQTTTQYLQQTTQQYVGQGYCSTLYATGPGLPTTAAGGCGTILVENASMAPGQVVIWVRVAGAVIMVQGLAAFLYFRR